MKYYLDANFLASYFISNHEKNNISTKKMAEILASNSEIDISTLTMDETWWVIFKHLKTNSEPFSDFYEDYKKVFSKLKSISECVFIQFSDLENGISLALDYINKFNLRPRDAFHFAIIDEQKLDCIVTFDTYFNSIRNKSFQICVL